MGHKIEKRDKQQGREMAWHQLTDIRSDLTLDKNWLTEWDGTPRKLELDGVETDFNILVGTDDGEIIGKPYANSYKPIDNKTFLHMIKEATVGIKGLKVESVGSVCNRGRVFISVSLKDSNSYKIGERQFKDFLNFGNAHDGSSVLWVNNTNICTVCNNTFSYNLNTQDSSINIKVYHRGAVEAKLANITEIIDAHLGSQAHYKAEFERLLKVEIDKDSARNLFAGWSLRNDKEKELSTRGLNKVNRLFELFNTGAGNRGENRADAFSAVTDYFTHESVRNSNQNVGKQFVSSEFGLGRIAKTDFWNVIRDDDYVNDYIKIGKKALQQVTV
jgi:hypothetical protein